MTIPGSCSTMFPRSIGAWAESSKDEAGSTGPMIIGVPKEIKEGEYRVALTPGGAQALRAAGHRVRLQKSAGEQAGFSDAEYRKAGAQIVPTAQAAWTADLVLKVKEPLPKEFA